MRGLIDTQNHIDKSRSQHISRQAAVCLANGGKLKGYLHGQEHHNGHQDRPDKACGFAEDMHGKGAEQQDGRDEDKKAVYGFALFLQDAVGKCQDEACGQEGKGNLQEGFGLEPSREKGISENGAASGKFPEDSKQDPESPGDGGFQEKLPVLGADFSAERSMGSEKAYHKGHHPGSVIQKGSQNRKGYQKYRGAERAGGNIDAELQAPSGKECFQKVFQKFGKYHGQDHQDPCGKGFPHPCGKQDDPQGEGFSRIF